MKIPAIFAGIPASYLVAAVIFGIVVAFGVGAMTYRPLPVQVQINQYAPMKAPEPAIPTVAPTVNPGPQSPYAPAPAPVVVTTAPLPTITAAPTPEIHTNCDVNAGSDATSLVCVMEDATLTIGYMITGTVPLVIIMAVFPIILMLCRRMLEFGRPPRNDW